MNSGVSIDVHNELRLAEEQAYEDSLIAESVEEWAEQIDRHFLRRWVVGVPQNRIPPDRYQPGLRYGVS